MSRHLENLKRLFNKLQTRIGVDDDLVIQLKHEISQCEVIKLKEAQWRSKQPHHSHDNAHLGESNTCARLSAEQSTEEVSSI